MLGYQNADELRAHGQEPLIPVYGGNAIAATGAPVPSCLPPSRAAMGPYYLRSAYAAQEIRVGEVGNRPVYLTRLKNPVVSGTSIGRVPNLPYRKPPEIPEFHRERPAPITVPWLEPAIRRNKESVAVPAVRRSPTRWQHVGRCI